MAAPRRRPSSYRRPILIYLLAIVGPTVSLLYLGLQSVQRQRQAIDSLTDSNMRLAGERLVSEVERRSLRLAEASLREGDLDPVVAASSQDVTPETARAVAIAVEKVRSRHPIARHLFILRGDAVSFPPLRTPSLSSVDVLLVRENPAVASKLSGLFAQAEREELREERCDLALQTYRRSAELPVSDSIRALVLARSARCLVKLHRPNAAEELYRRIGEQYGDLYDPFHRPYGLVAGLELDELSVADSPTRLARLYGELARGRWELSAEQAEYFLDQLRRRLRVSGPAPTRTEYLGRLEFARALQAGFRHHGPLGPGEVYTYGFTRGDTDYQTYYIRAPGEPAGDTIVGLAVDLDWVARHLLPEISQELGLAPAAVITVGRPSTAAPEAGTRAAQIPFRRTFPFWQLSIAPGDSALATRAAGRDAFVFAGSTALILVALVVGVVLLIRDVSRDQQLNRLRTDLVSGVSHELKTPLTLIRLYAETLSEDQEIPDGERRSYYEVITRASERLTHLVEKVLDFSRIERGRTTYDLTDGDIGSVVARTVEIYGQHLRRRGFTIKATLASAMPQVRFDAEAVAGAVLNLLENAAKYSGDSRSIEVRLITDEEHVIVEVEDHGVGIAAEEQGLVFEQFYRSGRKGGTGGYGLGLYLVRHVMEEHAGHIELDSEPGCGSRFRLVFPAVSAVTRGRSEAQGPRVT